MNDRTKAEVLLFTATEYLAKIHFTTVAEIQDAIKHKHPQIMAELADLIVEAIARKAI
jgi:hypothetical protein